MFLGQFLHNIDDKGRLALPKKIRALIESRELVLIRGFESCIFGFEKSVWEKESAKQLENPISDKESRNLRRYLFSGASIEEIDKVGRILLPASLKEYAKVKENVIVIGAGDHFEIWDANIWKDYLAQLEKDNG